MVGGERVGPGEEGVMMGGGSGGLEGPRVVEA